MMNSRALTIAVLLFLSAQTVAIVLEGHLLVRAWNDAAELQTGARLAASNAEGWKAMAGYWKSLAAQLAAGAACTDEIGGEARPWR